MTRAETVEFDAYQEYVMTRWLTKTGGVPERAYCALALAGEVGELAEKIKKGYRDESGVFDPEARRAIALELGDILFYATKTAELFGYRLSAVAEANVDKLNSRAARGVMSGSGDDR